DMKQVVFGTGPIGATLADQLAAAGHKTVAVNRSGRASTGSGVDLVAGDAADPTFTVSVSEGAEVIYQTLNPPYTKWPKLFPPLQTSLLVAARATGAKLVTLDNMYGYGPTGPIPITEDLPYRATGSKGRVRAEMARELMAAHVTGDARISIGRASDYFGPGGLVSHMGERVFRPALAGKKAQVMGDPDQPHTFSYIPDIAAGLAKLGSDSRADGRVWHLPNAPTVTTRQFIEQVYEAAGTPVGVSAMPRAMVGLLGVFNANVREVKEVLFEFEEPFVVDSSAFESTFDQSATPLDEAIPATVEWFKANPKS
ncbi:MAG: NAD-dependent epimerase/dehydratase family protein, partial [Acidimicrobiia bacterium]